MGKRGIAVSWTRGEWPGGSANGAGSVTCVGGRTRAKR